MRLVQQTTQMLPACHLLLLVLLQNIWRCCGQARESCYRARVTSKSVPIEPITVSHLSYTSTPANTLPSNSEGRL